MEKKVLWVGLEKDWKGRHTGALIDASEVVDSVYLGEDHVLVWDEVDGKSVPTIPATIVWDGEEYSGIQDMDRYEAKKYLDSLVGSESRTADYTVGRSSSGEHEICKLKGGVGMTFEKCPYCGAWRLKKEMVNHIGACSLYQINKMEKPQLAHRG